MMNILIVKLSSIGDVVHALPALAAMRKALPEARISWVVERSAAEILRGNRLIDDLIEVDTRGWRKLKTVQEKIAAARTQLKALRKSQFDVALDFQGLLKSAMIAKLSGAKRRVGFDKKNLREPASRFLLTETVNIETQTHIVKKNLSLAAHALNFDFDEKIAVSDFPIATFGNHEIEAVETIVKCGSDFVILNPGGGWTTKLWATEKFGTLADKIFQEFNLRSIVSIGPGEESLAQSVAANVKTHQSLTAKLSLKGFYELCKRAKLYVGGDTGPTHLAIAANAPVVGIFGPTEWWRNGSLNPADICVERTEIGCRENCHRRSCDNWICLDIEVERTFAAVKARLR